ncbi:hypothetical protein V8D89_013343, partial [Ganoderma adspersum]
MDTRSCPTEPNSPSGLPPSSTSSPDSPAFFSISVPSSPLVNVSDGGLHQHHPDLSGQPPILPPVPYRPSPLTTPRSSCFLVPQAPIASVMMHDALVDIRRQITSILDAQDPAIMTTGVATPSGTGRPNTASDFDFDLSVREQGARTRRRGRDGFIHNNATSRASPTPIVLASEQQLPYQLPGQVSLTARCRRSLLCINIRADIAQDNSNGRPVSFGQQNETDGHLHVHDQRPGQNVHDCHTEIRSVSARLEQTRDEIIPLLNQIATAMPGSFLDPAPPRDAAISAVATPEMYPPETIEVLPSYIPHRDSFSPAFISHVGGRFPADVGSSVIYEPKPVARHNVTLPGPFAAHADDSPLFPTVVQPPSPLLSRPLSDDHHDDIPRQPPTPSNTSSPEGPLYPLRASTSPDHHRLNDDYRSRPRTRSRSRQHSSPGSAHSVGCRHSYLGDDSPRHPSPSQANSPRLRATAAGRSQNALDDSQHHARPPVTSIVPLQPDSRDIEERERERARMLEQNDMMRSQLGDLSNAVTEQRDAVARKREHSDERLWAKPLRAEKDAQDAATRNMLEQILANQAELMNANAASKDELMEEMRDNQRQALDAVEQHRIVYEGTIRDMADAWRADCEQQKMETIEAVKAMANEQVPYNIQGYVDEFSRMLAIEVRMLLSEVGKLREDKTKLEFQIGELLVFRAKYGPDGQSLSSRTLTTVRGPTEAATGPESAPEPLPEGPQHAPSARPHALPSRIPRRMQYARPPSPRERLRAPSATQSWRRGNVTNPAFQPSPPIRSLNHLLRREDSPGLFGPRSPAAS